MFRDCNMHNIDLSGAHLKRAVFTNVNLGGINLSGANLCGADLRGAHFQKIDGGENILTGAVYDKQTQWPTEFDYNAAGAVVRQLELSDIIVSTSAPKKERDDERMPLSVRGRLGW